MFDPTREQAEELYRKLAALTPDEQVRYVADHGIPPEVCAAAADLLAADLTERGAAPAAEGETSVPPGAERDLLQLGLNDQPTEIDCEADWPIGDSEISGQLAGRPSYPRRRELGRGGMGAVYEVWDATIERPLAMKMLLENGPPGNRDSLPQLVARFLKEAQITGQIDHPGVVPVHEIARDEEGKIFFTMQVVAGRSLKEILLLPREVREKEGWNTTRLLGVVLKVCETLAYAHSKGFVHRDLKPANIMVGQFGETYVMDWGLAKRLQNEEAEEDEPDAGESRNTNDDRELPEGGESLTLPAELTLLGEVLGTPMYMPPEQASGMALNVNGRGDVYAVGAMLYEILAGHPPYFDQKERNSREILKLVRKGPPTPLLELAASTPAELIAISEKAMARSQEERYETMAKMGDDVRAFLEDRVVQAYRTGAVAEFKKWVRRNRGVATAGLVAVLVASVSFTVVTWIQAESNQELAGKNVEIRAANTETEQALNQERLALRRARSLVLAGKSDRVLNENPAAALLLGLEANRLTASPDVNRAILRALAESRELTTFSGCPPHLNHVAVDSTGSRLAGATADHDIYIADLESGKRIALCAGHIGHIRHLAFSPNGERLVSASRDGSVIVWDSETGRKLITLGGHKGGAAFAEYSPDASLIVSRSQARTLRVWNAATGAALTVETDRMAGAYTGEFTPAGDGFLIGSVDGLARLVNLVPFEIRALFGPHEGGVSTAEYSRAGNHVLTLALRAKVLDGEKEQSTESACYLWNSDGTLRKKLRREGTTASAAAFSGDGAMVVVGFGDGVVEVWNLETMTKHSELPPQSDAEIRAIAVNEDGSLLVTGTTDGIGYVWNGLSGELRSVLRGHDERINAIALVRNGQWAVTSSEDDTARFWSLRKHGPLGTIAGVVEASLHSDGSKVLTRGKDSPNLREWTVPDGKPSAVLTNDGAVGWASYLGDGNSILALNENRTASLWVSGEKKSLFGIETGADALPPRVSRDGQFLLTADPTKGIVTRYRLPDGTMDRRVEVGESRLLLISANGRRLIAEKESQIELWSLGSGNKLAEPVKGSQGTALFSPGGEQLVTWPHLFGPASGGVSRYGLKLWDAISGTLLREIDGHSEPILGVNFGPEGKTLITSSGDRTARLWDCRSGRLIQAYSGHGGDVESCWVARDGHRVLTSCFKDLATRLWNGETGKQIEVLGQDEQRVLRPSLSALGNYVTTLFEQEPGAAIWSAKTGKLKTLLPGDKSRITSVKMSADEKWVLTVSEDGVARIWPVDVAGYAQQFVPRELMPMERELHQVGEKEERERHAALWMLNREVESMKLLEKAVEGGGAEALKRVQRSFRRSLRVLAEALPKVAEADAQRGENQMVASLKTLGEADGEAHFLVAEVQVALGGSGAKATIERGLDVPGLDEKIALKLKDLTR